MAPWNSSPQVDVQLHFDREDTSTASAPAPLFVGEEYITGAATFSLRKDYESITYKIAIKGTVKTKTTELPAGGLQSTASIETQTFLSATLLEGSRPAVLGDNARYIARMPFKFNLANNHNHSDNSSESSRMSGHPFPHFLPSIDSRTSGRHWSSTFKSGPDAQYTTTYTIIASAVTKKRRVFSGSRNFSYFPGDPDAGPVALEDFPEEYVVRTTKAIDDSSSTSRIGMIGQEPRTMALHPNIAGGETDIGLFLVLFRNGATSFGKESLPKQARIKGELRTTTFILDHACTRAAHTLQGAIKTGAVVKQDRSHTQECLVPLDQWHRADSESEEDRSNMSEEVLTNALSVPFKIHDTRLLPPAFYSPLLSRRYAIDLILMFDDDSSTAMKLRLPLQIGYEA